jgi:hypothetical protein|tara:strand:+ start:189 stop:356 length:168 start_codon:yes stop_codon:yes gene_type:complete
MLKEQVRMGGGSAAVIDYNPLPRMHHTSISDNKPAAMTISSGSKLENAPSHILFL